MIQVEYIESTGTQFITTPIFANTPNLRFVAELAITGVTSTSSSGGDGIWAGNWTVNGYLFIRYGASPGVFRWHSGGAVSQDIAVVLNQRYNIETNANGIIIDGINYSLPTHSGVDANVPVSIFYRTQGSAGSPSKMRLYSCKVYSEDTLLADYIPALNENNVACLYDAVSDTYLYNSGTGDFTAGDPVAPFFTVKFDAAGGDGSMPNQVIFIDTPTALTECTFTRDDYIFSGWATEQGGSVVFSDGEEVLNLTGENETITLYAVWSPKPLHFILQYNQSDADHLDKEITDLHDLVGIFRDDCTIEDPVVLLEGNPDLLTGVNYFTIPKFNRSYFLTGQRIVRTNLIEITGHVDVLSSFKTYIRQQTAIVKRQETNKAYNLYIDDSSLRSYQNPIVLTQIFPKGFNGQSFILATAGVAGTAPVDPPSAFTATGSESGTSNIITWTAAENVINYSVYAKFTNDLPFNYWINVSGNLNPDVLTFTHNPLSLATRYYKVIASNTYGETSSNIVQIPS